MRLLGSPYSRCTDGVQGVDIPLLYNSSYTMQVRPAPGGGGGAGGGGARVGNARGGQAAGR